MDYLTQYLLLTMTTVTDTDYYYWHYTWHMDTYYRTYTDY